MPSEEMTPEEIAGTYNAAMDSVNLINRIVDQESLSEDDQDTVSRNVEHLKIQVGKDFWTTEDLTPFNDTITAGEAVLPDDE